MPAGAAAPAPFPMPLDSGTRDVAELAEARAELATAQPEIAVHQQRAARDPGPARRRCAARS